MLAPAKAGGKGRFFNDTVRDAFGRWRFVYG